MATVILVRHGRTTANTAGVLAGRTPGVQLDDRGREQARAAGERLAGLPLRGVVTSPLERCRETAAAIAGAPAAGGPASSASSGAGECDYGEWTGRHAEDAGQGDALADRAGAPSGRRASPAASRCRSMAARAVAAVRRWDARVEAEHGADAVWVAVSHGDVIKAILADALGMHLDAFQRIVVDPASVSVVRYTPRPAVRADVQHPRRRPRPASRRRRRRSGRGARRRGASDAVVGGGAGPRPRA